MIDVEVLLAECAEAPPCGPDLEYDAAFMELDQSSKGKPEQQFGDTLIAAEEPDWGAVRAQSEALLARTKDLRVAMLLARALVWTEGFAGLKPGLLLLCGLIERYWEGVHPLLDPEDGLDPIMRMNALAPLGDGAALVRDVREAAILRARGQALLLVRDIAVAQGKLAPRPDAEPMAQSVIDGMLTEAGPDVLENAVATFQALNALISLLDGRVGSDQAPDLKPLVAIVQPVSQVAEQLIAANAEAAPAGEDAPEGAEAAATGAAPVKAARGEILTREDALKMIEKIIVYLERNEPTSPAPLLLRRAVRLMGMSFVDIIRDMAPDSMDRIETIAGLTREEE
jgi:type VI secretion system protein ImpA